MRMPTHIVIDLHDGFVFARDAGNYLFTEQTATQFTKERNDEMKPEHRSYIVAAVTPLMSPELMAASIRNNQPELEAGAG